MYRVGRLWAIGGSGHVTSPSQPTTPLTHTSPFRSLFVVIAAAAVRVGCLSFLYEPIWFETEPFRKGHGTTSLFARAGVPEKGVTESRRREIVIARKTETSFTRSKVKRKVVVL